VRCPRQRAAATTTTGASGGVAAAAELPAPTGPRCLPYFGGSLHYADASGVFVGLTPDVSDAVLAGAWLEGLVLELARGVDLLGTTVTLQGPVTVAGGGAADGPFAGWLADALGRPVQVVTGAVGAVGAAAVARTALGGDADVAGAVARLGLVPAAVYAPDPGQRARWRVRLAGQIALADRWFTARS